MMSVIKILINTANLFVLFSCTTESGQERSTDNQSVIDDTVEIAVSVPVIDTSGNTLSSRFPAPYGYFRKDYGEHSYAAYLRSLPLRPHGSAVLYYDGTIKPNLGNYQAVIDQDIGKKDLHQCADAVMNLYALYHYEQGNHEAIHFNFTNGWRCDFKQFAAGYRVSFENRQTRWVKKAEPSSSINTLEKYMDLIFTYCGTASLEKELKPVENFSAMETGDVFIKGGHPGHAIMVVDIVENDQGEKQFLLAQSYMPAQQMQILSNPNRNDDSPWYRMEDIGTSLVTPEWTFTPPQLMRFSFK